MGNPLAYLMLLIWPFVCLWLFRTQRVERALIWSILGGYLLLPPLTEFDLPLVPDMDKATIPNLAVLTICIFAIREKVALWPQSRVAIALALGLIASAAPTVLTNADVLLFEVLPGTEPIRFITNVIPGQSWRDLGSVLAGQALAIVPFLLARHYLRHDEGLRELTLALLVGGLAYSLPSLFEIAMSPILNIYIYGFFQHDFSQMIRQGGYRPIVFLPHGLWLAVFMTSAMLACAAMFRAAPVVERGKWLALTGYLFMVLFLCKSLASLLYGLLLLPVVLFLPAPWQIRLALGFAIIAVAYPMLRNLQLIPLDWIMEQANAISEERAQSLGYRFDNEELLLGRAAEKPLFGWGGWGRNLLRHPETGNIVTVPDGRWIIIFGTYGWAGYIFEFGLLSWPLVLIWWSLGRSTALSPYIAPLCLILGVTMIDMLLNDTLTPHIWLIAGAILGHAESRMPRAVKNQGDPAARTVLTRSSGAGGRRTVL
ncbi:MAG: hypothetical protein P1U53_11490 [Sulfitobacter sp.]|nr:hypothetical protein [Sulfitobacter sp.]